MLPQELREHAAAAKKQGNEHFKNGGMHEYSASSLIRTSIIQILDYPNSKLIRLIATLVCNFEASPFYFTYRIIHLSEPLGIKQGPKEFG